MPRKVAPLLPSTSELLLQLGERLRLARRRRRLTAKSVAKRAGMAPMTLRSVERGRSGVTIGAYLAVMQVLGIEKDLDLLAQSDPIGRSLQDARLSAPHGYPAVPDRPTPRRTARPPVRLGRGGASDRKAFEKDGFASSEALASLIKVPSPPASHKKRSG